MSSDFSSIKDVKLSWYSHRSNSTKPKGVLGRFHNEEEISSGICADRLHIDIRHPEIHRYTSFKTNGSFTPAIYYGISNTIAQIVAQPILEPNGNHNRNHFKCD